MNELVLYAIIKAVLEQSAVIGGRFHVASGYGNDLNANALDKVVNELPAARQKYPVSVLMPPVEIIDKYESKWTRFKMEQYFLCLSGNLGTGGMKAINAAVNASQHSTQYDWKDMRECAINFRMVLNTVLRRDNLLAYVNSASDSKDYMQRVSAIGNDKLNGVRLSYELNVAMPCTLVDYPAIDAITLPDVTAPIHESHEH